MKKVNIGLDIGIASVGWAILDEDLKIINHGVRLFPTVDDPKDGKLNNEVRREKRSMRRQKNRRRNLKLDFIKLCQKYQLIDLHIDPYDRKQTFYDEFLTKYINPQQNLFNLRQKGLKEKLSRAELIQTLYWYLSHRGFKYEIVDEEDNKEQTKIKAEFAADFDNKKLPIEMQTQYFSKHGYYRSEFNRLFSANDYKKELQIILNHSSNIDNFNQEYIALFMRQRDFEVGPGPKIGYENLPLKNPQLISPYSRYYINPQTNKLEAHNNIWDKTIGKCTYFPNENRAPKNSFTAELFNLLNDLNNLSIGAFKLSIAEKKECLKIAFAVKDNSKKIMQWIIKRFNVETQDDIKGWRKDKNKAPLFTPLTSLHFVNKQLQKNHQDIISFHHIFDSEKIKVEIIDNIVDILSKTKVKEKRIEELKAINFNEKAQEDVAQGPNWSQTHALSYKAMRQMLPILLENSDNQMQIVHKLGWKSAHQLDLENRKYLPKDWIDNLIGTPSVKRAIRQTINLLNTILKKMPQFKIANIVIEMARELNNDQKRQSILEMQNFIKKRKDILQSRIEAIKDKYQLQEVSDKALAKLWLYEQQNGCDVYTGEQLDPDKIIFDANYTDIDHIIPYSQCFDDSRDNKVLTLKINNAQKGQKTPYQWWQNNREQFVKMKNKWKEWYSPEYNKANRKVFASAKKLAYLCSEIDYADPINAISFIGRNLVDTRYINREILNLIKTFSTQVPEGHALFKTQVIPINGKITNFFRKMLESNKEKYKLKRPEGLEDGSFDPKTGQKQRVWNGHHAEDAVIICYAALKNFYRNKLIEKVLSDANRDEVAKIAKKWSDKVENFETIAHLRHELNNNLHRVKFSYMLNKRANTPLFNESLYSLKKQNGKLYKVDKINLIDLDTNKLQELFADNYKYEILMQKYDQKTFAALRELYLQHQTENYPFKVLSKGQKYIEVSVLNDKKQNIIRKIRNIRIVKEEKKVDDIILRDSNSFYESMKWTEIHLFKNQKGLYRIIPINATVAKYKSNAPYELKPLYYQKLQEFDIDVQAKPLYIINYGTIISDPEFNLYRVCGVDVRQNRLELKRIDIMNKSKIQNYCTINKKMLNYKIVELDYLGNIYEKYEFVIENKKTIVDAVKIQNVSEDRETVF